MRRCDSLLFEVDDALLDFGADMRRAFAQVCRLSQAPGKPRKYSLHLPGGKLRRHFEDFQ